MNAYSRRNRTLKTMGYTGYDHYLDSRLWKGIRDRVLARDNRQCLACGSPAKCVHHLDYRKDTLLGNRIDGLVSLCHECHQLAEFTRSGKKRRKLQRINRVLLGLATKNGLPTKWFPHPAPKVRTALTRLYECPACGKKSEQSRDPERRKCQCGHSGVFVKPGHKVPKSFRPKRPSRKKVPLSHIQQELSPESMKFLKMRKSP